MPSTFARTCCYAFLRILRACTGLNAQATLVPEYVRNTPEVVIWQRDAGHSSDYNTLDDGAGTVFAAKGGWRGCAGDPGQLDVFTPDNNRVKLLSEHDVADMQTVDFIAANDLQQSIQMQDADVSAFVATAVAHRGADVWLSIWAPTEGEMASGTCEDALRFISDNGIIRARLAQVGSELHCQIENEHALYCVNLSALLCGQQRETGKVRIVHLASLAMAGASVCLELSLRDSVRAVACGVRNGQWQVAQLQHDGQLRVSQLSAAGFVDGFHMLWEVTVQATIAAHVSQSGLSFSEDGRTLLLLSRDVLYGMAVGSEPPRSDQTWSCIVGNVTDHRVVASNSSDACIIVLETASRDGALVLAAPQYPGGVVGVPNAVAVVSAGLKCSLGVQVAHNSVALCALHGRFPAAFVTAELRLTNVHTPAQRSGMLSESSAPPGLLKPGALPVLPPAAPAAASPAGAAAAAAAAPAPVSAEEEPAQPSPRASMPDISRAAQEKLAKAGLQTQVTFALKASRLSPAKAAVKSKKPAKQTKAESAGPAAAAAAPAPAAASPAPASVASSSPGIESSHAQSQISALTQRLDEVVKAVDSMAKSVRSSCSQLEDALRNAAAGADLSSFVTKTLQQGVDNAQIGITESLAASIDAAVAAQMQRSVDKAMHEVFQPAMQRVAAVLNEGMEAYLKELRESAKAAAETVRNAHMEAAAHRPMPGPAYVHGHPGPMQSGALPIGMHAAPGRMMPPASSPASPPMAPGSMAMSSTSHRLQMAMAESKPDGRAALQSMLD